jgi:hypothetical protein
MELEIEKAPVSVTLIHPGRIDTPYNEHAQSYYAHQVAHRGMVYPPETAAESILFAAAHPKRDMYVGFQAKALAAVGHLAPRLMDKIMEVLIYPTQIDPKRSSRNHETSGLYHAGYGLQERGSHEGWFRSGSWYVKAQKHPLLAAAAIAGLGTAAWMLGKSRDGQNGTRKPNGVTETNNTVEANQTHTASVPIKEAEAMIVDIYGDV